MHKFWQKLSTIPSVSTNFDIIADFLNLMVGPHSSIQLLVLYRQPHNGGAYQWRLQTILTSSPLVTQRKVGGGNHGQTFTSLTEMEAFAASLQALQEAPEPSKDGALHYTELLVRLMWGYIQLATIS